MDRCTDQLQADVYGITEILHAAFEDVGDTELPGDFRQVAESSRPGSRSLRGFALGDQFLEARIDAQRVEIRVPRQHCPRQCAAGGLDMLERVHALDLCSPIVAHNRSFALHALGCYADSKALCERPLDFTPYHGSCL